jgi:hypothetical protein
MVDGTCFRIQLLEISDFFQLQNANLDIFIDILFSLITHQLLIYHHPQHTTFKLDMRETLLSPGLQCLSLLLFIIRVTRISELGT